METSQYLDLFISEAQDHLQEMNQALLSLEKRPDDLGQLEAFFRAAHTLKSMSATMGFQQMAALAHDMEDLLDALRHRERHLTLEVVDTLFRCLDVLGGLLQQVIAGHGDTGDTAALRARLRSVLESPAAEVPAAPSAIPEVGWEVLVEVAPDCVLRGPRAFLVWKRASTVAPPVGSDPPPSALRAGQYEDRFSLFFAPAADPVALEKAVYSVSEVVAVTVRQVGVEVFPTPAPPAAVPSVPPAGEATPVTAPPPVAEAPPPVAEAGPAVAAPLVRIKVALLDQLLETVADLVINRSRMVQIARRFSSPDLDEAVEAYATALERLQETVLTMRMTPAAQVFNRFPRMVRDLAHQQGKEIRFEMEGAEIELDRTILEKVSDPLVHLLRNAVDHGIESPEERRRAGKPLPACIRLRARRVQDKAVIEVQDDGRGMSSEKIARVAVERGLVTAQEVAEMDEAAIFELICRPDFSTRTEVTGVSGRGIGMAVVKQVMEEIGGTLEIESQPGVGSRFQLAFPLTMAIIPALLVRVERDTYALPLAHVVRTIEPQRSEVRFMHHQAVLSWGERVLPLISLADLLQIGQGKPQATVGEETLPVIVVERARQRYGLVVDEILGKEDIVLKPLGPFLQGIEGLAGATIRGAGEIVLILDVPGLLRRLAREEQ